jgi:Domain of unknown function (DUF1730)
MSEDFYTSLASSIRSWGFELGFQQIGIAGIRVADDEDWLMRWLELGRHGEMGYMPRHGRRRGRPEELVPGTIRLISARMDYLQPNARDAEEVLNDPTLGYVSRYALGRDYHKVLRRRLAELAERVATQCVDTSYRVFVDSGPVLEKAYARAAGLGWIGKHTNLINRTAGSWFFLGEILTDLPLPIDAPATARAARASIFARRKRSLRLTSSTHGAAFRISRLSYASRFRSNFVRQSVIAFMVATTASWCAHGTSSRRRLEKWISKFATAWMLRRSPHCSDGAKRSSRAVRRAAQFAASVMNAGLEMSRSHSVTRPLRRP